MAVNDATIRLITEFEGFVPTWYKDPVGIWTVGFGHTDAAGKPKYAETKAKQFTREEGMNMLRNDLGQYEAAVNRAVKVPLNANQYGALVSFTYNLGAGNLEKSTLVKKINAGDFEGAANEFKKWNKAGGKVLAGLTRRREAERQLFVAPSGKPSIVPKPSLPSDAPIVIEPMPEAPKRSALTWIIGFVIIAAIAFFVTQVRF